MEEGSVMIVPIVCKKCGNNYLSDKDLDYQCPRCGKKYHEGVVLQRDYIDEIKDNINSFIDTKKLDGGGKRFNKDKAPVHLLVPEAMEAEARVWGLGAKKYGTWNWQRGMKWTTVLGCLLRHTFAIMRGEDIDKESGELHAAHIKCNASMLIHYYHNYKEGDDRNTKKESNE